jgi:hypothetical protein
MPSEIAQPYLLTEPEPDENEYDSSQEAAVPLHKWLPSSYSWKSKFGPASSMKLMSNLRPTVDSHFDFQKILDFVGDPDDVEFVRCSNETVERTKRFLSPFIFLISSKPFLPTVSPGPAGSIDIHWKTPKKELLINIPSDSKSPARFYGDDYGQLCIEGTLIGGRLNALILIWLLDSNYVAG